MAAVQNGRFLCCVDGLRCTIWRTISLMWSVLAVLVLLLSACASDPTALGITGPAQAGPPPRSFGPAPGTLAPPTISPEQGANVPGAGDRRFWGYN